MDDMAGHKQASTARLRRLAADLKRLRVDSDEETTPGRPRFTQEQVTERTGINKVTLYRIETAKVRPQLRTLKALLDLYGVTDEAERARLISLTRDSAQLEWLQRFEPDLPEEYQQYIGFESEATAIKNYESLYIPGLLQTEAYAQAVIRGVLPEETENGLQQRVEVRMQRQAALTKEGGLHLWAVIDEAAIRRQVGGTAVMRKQLEHLATISNEPNVVFQILPYSAGAHPGMPGSFLLMDFPDDAPPLLYSETAGGGLVLEAESDVERYRGTFMHLVAQALSAAETLKMIRAAVKAA